jgi:uncharacterized membrane protein
MVWARIRLGFVGVVDLFRIVPAALQFHQLVVAQMRHQVEQFGILAEEILANIGAVFADVGLELAIHHLAHALFEQPGGIAAQEFVPIAAPDHLNHLPAGAAEGGL